MPLSKEQKDKLEADKAALQADEAKVAQDEAALVADIDALESDAPVVVDPPPVNPPPVSPPPVDPPPVIPPVKVPPTKVPPVNPPPVDPPPVEPPPVNPPPVEPPPVNPPVTPVTGTLSLTFVPYGTDPAALTSYGLGAGRRGYGSIRPNLAGELVLFGSASGHDSHGYNGIDIIGATGIRNVRPHTEVKLGPATAATNNLVDGSGLNFMMGRDNQAMIVLPNGKLYVTDGEREPGVFANYGGVADLFTGAWQISDTWGSMPGVDGGVLPKLEDGASARIDALGIGVIYGNYTNAQDFLQIIAPNPAGGTNPFRSITFANPDLAQQFPGSRHLRYVSGQSFAYGTQLRIYGGKGGDTPTSHYDLFAIELADINNPKGVLISTNTVPVGQRVEGEAIIAMDYPGKNGMLVTNGVLANWYDYTTGNWSVVNITNPAAFRTTPEVGGSGAFASYSLALLTGVVLWSNGAIETMTLTNSGTPVVPPVNPPPVDPPPVDPPSTTVSAVTGITANGLVSGTAADGVSSVGLTFDGSQVQGAATVAVINRGWLYQIPARFFDGQQHVLRVRENVTGAYYSNANKDDGKTFGPLSGDLPPAPVTPPTTTPPVDPPPVTPPPVNNPPPPPVIVSTPGTAPGANGLVMTTVMHPWNDSFSTLSKAKHLHMFLMPDGKARLFPKDCASTTFPAAPTGSVDGNQEIYMIDFDLKKIFLEQGYFIRDNTKIQGTNPDDAFCIVRGNKYYYFFSEDTMPETLNDTHWPPADGTYATPVNPRQFITSYLPASLGGPLWAVEGPASHLYQGDRGWRGLHDPVRDKFIIPVNAGNQTGFAVFDGPTLKDETKYDGTLPWSYGPTACFTAGVAVDWLKRKIYMFDTNTMSICVVDIDAILDQEANAFPQIVYQCAPFQGPVSTQYTGKIAFDEDIRAWCMPVVDQWYVGRVDSGQVSSFARQDGRRNVRGDWIQLQDSLYVPATATREKAIVTMGSIDFSDPNNESFMPGWFETQFKIAA